MWVAGSIVLINVAWAFLYALERREAAAWKLAAAVIAVSWVDDMQQRPEQHTRATIHTGDRDLAQRVAHLFAEVGEGHGYEVREDRTDV